MTNEQIDKELLYIKRLVEADEGINIYEFYRSVIQCMIETECVAMLQWMSNNDMIADSHSVLNNEQIYKMFTNAEGGEE